MSRAASTVAAPPHRKERDSISRFSIVGLGYVTLYPVDFAAALRFYESVLGPLDRDDPDDEVWGWRMGNTWLTLAPNAHGTEPGSEPRNVEFAIEVASLSEVDRLYRAFVAAGATPGSPPRDTEMYVPMRYAYVDDPFGVRIDVVCRARGAAAADRVADA